MPWRWRYGHQQSGDLRRGHLDAAGPQKRAHAARAVPARPRRRQGSAARVHSGQSASGAERHPALSQPRRERGRSLSGRLYRADEGHRQLRYRAKRALLDLCRANDHRRDPPLSEGQQPDTRFPLPARHGLQGPQGPRAPHLSPRARAEHTGDRRRDGGARGGRGAGAGGHSGPGLALRPRLSGWRRRHLRHGSGARRARQRG